MLMPPFPNDPDIEREAARLTLKILGVIAAIGLTLFAIYSAIV